MVGQRFDYQTYPEGQRGGLSLYPHGGIVSGLEVSTVVANGAGNVNLSMSVSAGRARIDGQLCTLTTAITGLILPVGTDVAVGTQKFDIWLNPRRNVVASTTILNTTPAAGTKYVKVLDRGDFQEVEKFYNYTGSAWEEYNAVSAPPGYSHNNLALNDINTVISTATTSNPSIAITPEKIIYHKVNYPVGLSAPGAAYFRYPASVKIASVTLVSGVATVTPYGDEVRVAI